MNLQPTFVDKDRFFVVGYSDYGAFFDTGDIPRLWDRFVPAMNNIPNRINPTVSYGVEFYHSDFLKTRSWNYMAAVEVSSLDDIPISMVGKVIPARRYAVFTHRGTPDGLPHLFQAIYSEWMPTSGYAPDGHFDLELYDERFRGDTADSEVDICIPVTAVG